MVRQGCTRAFHVSAASAAMLRTSQRGRRVSWKGSVAIGSCARPPWHSGAPSNQFVGQCGISASARLRDNGRVHGWANGGAASKPGHRGARCSDTGRCSGTQMQASSPHRVLAVTAPCALFGRHCLCRCVRWLLRRNATRDGAAHAAHDDVAAVHPPPARPRARAADVVKALAALPARFALKPRDAPRCPSRPLRILLRAAA
jgi:hypothetical protein